MAKELTITASNLHLLSSLPSTLQYLNCNNKNLTSLPPLPSTLKYLDCSNNNLTSLPLLPSGLISLYCNNNNLTSLPLLPPGLKRLYCLNNNLTSLPLLPPTLKELYCCSNNLPDWYIFYDIEEIREKQIQERLLLIRKKIASRIIQRAWTRYWYYPSSEGISRYASHMANVDLQSYNT